MKTWEMIKELTEHPERKYKQATADVPAKAFIDELGLLKFEHDSGIKFSPFLNEEWEEVIEPVDFITAYQDCLENKVVYIDEYNARMLDWSYTWECVRIVPIKQNNDGKLPLLIGDIKWTKKDGK